MFPRLFSTAFRIAISSSVALAGCVFSGGLSCTGSGQVSTPQSAPIAPEAGDHPSEHFRTFKFDEGGSRIDLRIADGRSPIPDQHILAWIRAAASAVSHYFGHFPLPTVVVTVVPQGDGKIENGVTNDHGIHVRLGQSTTDRDLADDWVMTHEMFHLAFPSIGDDYVWLSEGLASYLEPLARARQGTISPAKVWADLVEGMPQGQPEPGDRGLDQTHTWGRTYWGGSMFCLLADIHIRQQTGNARSLDDAMRAILDHGGNRHAKWPIEKVFRIGDTATGTRVLHDLHSEMGQHPVTVDLSSLWSSLGIHDRNSHVTFDDTAPLASVRRSMTDASANPHAPTPWHSILLVCPSCLEPLVPLLAALSITCSIVGEADAQRVQDSLTRGRPLGGEAWTRRMAHRLGLQYTLNPRGRPPKKNDPGRNGGCHLCSVWMSPLQRLDVTFAASGCHLCSVRTKWWMSPLQHLTFAASHLCSISPLQHLTFAASHLCSICHLCSVPSRAIFTLLNM